jgi:hypothetical protein
LTPRPRLTKSLLYRGSQLTNVFVQPYNAMYNYSTLGLK